MWTTEIKNSYVALGIAASGIGLFGAKYLLKHYKLTSATKRILDAEEQGATKAERILLASSFYGDLAGLKKQIKGEVILPTDRTRYHACRRRAFNLNQRGYPCVIVRVQNTKDVATCVEFVNKHRKDVILCIAGGCHSSKCMINYAFVIDLVNMHQAVLDKENMVVKVEGGAYVRELDKVLEPYNFGVTVGTYPLTGVGGLALGGGFGHLGRMLGFTVDNLLEAEVVLQNGEVVIANEEKNQDLIWGIRGGAGNFGIVTKFTFRVHKLPPYCISGTVVHFTPTLNSAISVASNFDKIITTLPNNYQALLLFPGGALVAPTVWGYFGDKKSVTEVPVMKQATNLGGWAVLHNSIKPNSYHKDFQTMTTPVIESGHIYHTLIQFGELDKDMPAELWEKLLTFTRKTLPKSLMKASCMLFTMGGALATSDPAGTYTCLTQAIRNARYFGIVEAQWKPEFGEEGKNAARDWARSVVDILRPFNDEILRYAITDADTLERDQPGYGKDNYPRLIALKHKYDPTNLFANNVNISPS